MEDLEPTTFSSEINITDDNIDQFLYLDIDRFLIVVIMPIIFTIGVLGNIAVILVFLRVRSMRTVTNHYLINLAIADLLFLLLAVTDRWVLYVSSPVQNDYTYTSIGFCKVIPYLQDVTIIVSCYTVILVTLERYIAICWPHKFKQLSTRPRAIFLCTLFWLFALIYKSPNLIFISFYTHKLNWPEHEDYENYPKNIVVCSYCQPRVGSCERFRKSLCFDQVILLMVIPITMVLYTLIVIQLQKLTKTSALRGKHSSSTKMKKQVVRMLIVTITVYVICITPFRIMNLFDIFHISIIRPEYMWLVVNAGRIMTYTNTAINPIIYNIMSDRYRQAFKETFFFCLPNYTAINVEITSKGGNTRVFVDKTTVNGR